MTSTYEETELFAPRRARIAYQWSASIRAACDTLSRMPADLIDSITVTGRLDGQHNERRALRELSLELAERNRLGVTVEAETADFTVRFCRSAAS